MGRSGDGRPPREGVGLDVNDARGAEGAGPGAGAPPVDDPRVREAERLLNRVEVRESDVAAGVA